MQSFRFLRALAFGFGMLAGVGSGAPPTPTPSRSAQERYLAFQLFSGSSETPPGADDQVLELDAPEERTEQFFRILSQELGTTGQPGSRLAVFLGPLAFDHSDDDLAAHIRHAFRLALQHDIAVGLHLDESKFWLGCEAFAERPDLLEWTDWDGSISTGQWLNWGNEFRLGPQLCLNHPDVRAEAIRRARLVLAPVLREEIAGLHAEGKEHLFAGIVIGWETALAVDRGTRRRVGYHALSRMGLTPDSPTEEVELAIRSLLEETLGIWATEFVNAGIPREKLYSHIAFDPERSASDFPVGTGLDGTSYAFHYGGAIPENAFMSWGVPGYSTYPTRQTFLRIWSEVDAATSSTLAWASVEGANVFLVNGGAVVPPDSMESYLGRMFNHGATLTILFGWGVGTADNPFRESAEAPESIASYRKFLSGQPLLEQPIETAYVTPAETLQAKLAVMHPAIEAYAKAGGDMALIQPLITELESLIAQGRLLEAIAVVDRILRITRGNPVTGWEVR